MTQIQIDNENIGLPKQVSHDLNNFIKKFESENYAIRHLSKESTLNPKTIKRLRTEENSPTAQTIFKLYSVIKSESDYEKLTESVPTVVKNELQKLEKEDLPKPVKLNISDEIYSSIKNDPIIGEIYMLAGATELSLCNIVYEYGQYGVRALEKLESLKLIVKSGPDKYRLHEKQPFLCGKVLKTIGLRLVSENTSMTDSELGGENFLGLYSEGLNQAGKNEWLKIDKKAFLEKIKLTKQEKYIGSIPCFTFQVSDSFKHTKK